ncbi:MAG: ribonuclease III [Rhodothermales bacterium]|nr:ribonuclease III [Rhodothermales bacterium]
MSGFLDRLLGRSGPHSRDASGQRPVRTGPDGSDADRFERKHPTGLSREAICDLVQAEVRDLALYEQALRHRSLLRGMSQAHVESNERLEYLGDAVLGFVIADVLYLSFPDKTEGFLTRVRSKLVNGRQLARSARRIDLGRYVQVGDSLASEEDIDNDSILADAFEAIVGAIYLDLGIQEVRTFIDRTLLEHLDLDEVAERRDNFKSALLEYLQARGREQPRYRVISETGPSHQKQFEVGVYLADQEYGRGEARSKKRAEQAAARIALERLRRADSADSQAE